ncbi:MAG: hypothetical protein A2Y57_00065 [Candidatus Woykebacteria bacterium RBG_13_40_7b]|uniref:Import component protein n=1 Tax=Candidatus Woykebacteria bacterium RBG_13_40_7b TaxID=1802594 RepID=A0A1G1W6N7_9BACT|nr:MAG: hypothetical protein A2Y57_00065 [Candidatus Woykebacteria bacterium RBG_13_40_7b]
MQQTGAKKISDDNLLAAISYISLISVVVLLTKKDSEYVRFHAKQGTVLFIVEVIWSVILFPFMWMPFLGSWLINLGWLVFIIASAVGFIKAYSGEKYRMPAVADFADKINV